jgi:hypothetical protein
MSGRSRARKDQQLALDGRRGDTGECAHLGVGDLTAAHRLRQEWQRGERAGDAQLLARRAQVESRAPHQPVSAGVEADVPPAARVELTQHHQQLVGGGRQLRRQLGDALAERLEWVEGRRRRWTDHLQFRTTTARRDNVSSLVHGFAKGHRSYLPEHCKPMIFQLIGDRGEADRPPSKMPGRLAARSGPGTPFAGRPTRFERGREIASPCAPKSLSRGSATFAALRTSPGRLPRPAGHPRPRIGAHPATYTSASPPRQPPHLVRRQQRPPGRGRRPAVRVAKACGQCIDGLCFIRQGAATSTV